MMADKVRSRVCEGDEAIITLFPDLCNRCGECIENCPNEVLGWSDDVKEKIAVLDISLCNACGRCQERCPEKALKVEKNWG
ncbi:ferredoxin family protein [bacterium]|nr:ferredoxin family protein [bacterium]